MNVIIKYQVALTGLYYGVLSHSEVPHFLPFFYKGDKKDMKDYYVNTRKCIDKYNNVQEQVKACNYELNDDQDEFLINFPIYLAHALIKDTGTGQVSREQLEKTADIINDVIR